jgi:geranylgeranyl diphosphate synthase type II
MEWLVDLSTKYETSLSELQTPEEPKNLYEPIRYFLSLGGKRIRPLLSILGCELFGGTYSDSIHAAHAVECFHNFSLIHDDIMDLAPLRRGKPTIHEKWNSTIGILSGDALLIYGYQELAKCNPTYLKELLTLYNTTAIEVCEGQQMDMDFETNHSVSIESYIEMIRLKTSVLLGCALKLGSIISGAKDEDKKLIYDFGVNIGLAFQIQDDILDLFGDPEKFGKQIGGDILSNKKTILLLTAYKYASISQKQELDKMLTIKQHEEKIQTARQLFIEIDVLNKVKDLMRAYQVKAQKSLEMISVEDKYKIRLRELSNYLINREL